MTRFTALAAWIGVNTTRVDGFGLKLALRVHTGSSHRAYTSSLGYNVSTSDVFGCAGSLASNAALCGALNRHVAQLPPAQWGDVSKYYLSAPANSYAQFWHNHAIGGKRWSTARPATLGPLVR